MNMKVSGVKYATIVAKDIDKAVAFYSELLDTKFRKATNNIAKVEVAISDEAGLEIVSPLSNADTPAARNIREFIEKHGEGALYLTCFLVDNADEGRLRAERMGIKGYWADIDEEEARQLSAGKIKNVKEYVLEPDVNHAAGATFLQIDYK